MKMYFLFLAGMVALAAFACGSECVTRSDCETGQYCEFTSGECLDGCRSNADCGRLAACDTLTGVCRVPPGTPVRDAGTSSVADGGT